MFENVDIVLSLVLAIIPVLLAVTEHFAAKFRPLFLVINTVYFAGACLFLLAKEGTLACVLITLCITIAVRLFLEISEGRKDR